jgi:hypothetical protein
MARVTALRDSLIEKEVANVRRWGGTIASLSLVVGSVSLTHFPQIPGTF